MRRAVLLGLVLLGVGVALGLTTGLLWTLEPAPPRRPPVSAPPLREPGPVGLRTGPERADWQLELRTEDLRAGALGVPLLALSWATPAEPTTPALQLEALALDGPLAASAPPVAEAPLALLLIAGGSALGALRARRGRAQPDPSSLRAKLPTE